MSTPSAPSTSGLVPKRKGPQTSRTSAVRFKINDSTKIKPIFEEIRDLANEFLKKDESIFDNIHKYKANNAKSSLKTLKRELQYKTAIENNRTDYEKLIDTQEAATLKATAARRKAAQSARRKEAIAPKLTEEANKFEEEAEKFAKKTEEFLSKLTLESEGKTGGKSKSKRRKSKSKRRKSKSKRRKK